MEKNKNRHEFTVEIKGKEWTDEVEKAYKKRNKTAKIAGFRPGKAPFDVYVKHYGEASLYFDAADALLQKAYAKMMKDEKVVPVVEPKVDIKDINKDGITYLFTVITKPEVKIKKYKNLGVKEEKVKVTKEELDDMRSKVLEKYNELVLKEGKVENGNVVTIDFEGFKDGKAFDGGKGENYSLEIGSHTFIPGFEEQLIGMKTEEEKEIKVTFPEDYGEKSLAGAEATFKVKVHEIKEKQTRELDEDFFEDLGMDGIDSEEKLKEEIKKSLEAQKEMDAENKYVDTLLETVSKNVDVDIPEEMVEEEVDRLMTRFEEQMKMQGISLDIYYQFTGSSEKDLRSQMEKEAYKNVLYRLMLEEISIIEKIEISKEEAEKEAEELAKKYQMKKADFLKEFGGIELIQYDLQMRRVLDLLKELNK